ncbi:MAG: peptide chain release factor N(5)-glutamine methyltransferase [Alphaproteobacteria bacterium]|nr:MAG: peptide chain release factor N(5)-glutamine methyltransferase [Alphaproteobacteria bacterium]
MKRSAMLAQAVRRLQAAGVEGAARDARLLLRHAAGLGAAELTARLAEEADGAECRRFADAIAARCRRQPVSQILGRRAFFGREFRVTPDVLDPRPESETLIETALARGPAARILDLGTGSGALMLTLLAEWPEARGLGIDASPAALAVARENARALGLEARAELRQGDWLDGVKGRFDLVICNPPYIAEAELEGLAPELRDWEPRIALSPGGDGLDVYRLLSNTLWLHISADGAALFEIGYGQASEVRKIFTNSRLFVSNLIPDMNGVPRCVIVQRRHSIGKNPPKGLESAKLGLSSPQHRV